MTIQTINLGSYANDGTGDDLRTAFQKVNENFSAISSVVTIANAANIGTGTGIFAQRADATLQFKSLVGANGLGITSSATTVTLSPGSVLVHDTAPSLGANLSLNGFDITGAGDIQATVWGQDTRILNSLITLFMYSNTLLNIDFGTYANPTGKSSENINGLPIDMGTFAAPLNNDLEFGNI